MNSLHTGNDDNPKNLKPKLQKHHPTASPFLAHFTDLITWTLKRPREHSCATNAPLTGPQATSPPPTPDLPARPVAQLRLPRASPARPAPRGTKHRRGPDLGAAQVGRTKRRTSGSASRRRTPRAPRPHSRRRGGGLGLGDQHSPARGGHGGRARRGARAAEACSDAGLSREAPVAAAASPARVPARPSRPGPPLHSPRSPPTLRSRRAPTSLPPGARRGGGAPARDLTAPSGLGVGVRAPAGVREAPGCGGSGEPCGAEIIRPTRALGIWSLEG